MRHWRSAGMVDRWSMQVIRTFVITPRISPIPKKERVWSRLGGGGLGGRVRRRARLALELATEENGRVEWTDKFRRVAELRRVMLLCRGRVVGRNEERGR